MTRTCTGSEPRAAAARAHRTASLALLLALACRSPAPKSAPEVPEAPNPVVRAIPWADDDRLLGTSGIALHPDGTVWVVPERTGTLVAQTLGPDGLGPPQVLQLRGIADGTDVEALAFVPGRPDLVLLGTEARGARREDPVLVARLGLDRAEVIGALVFDYGPFGIEASDNQGIEGLCAVEGFAVAASEAVHVANGQRFATVGRFTLTSSATEVGTMQPFRVALHSEKGKLSGLTCRDRAGRIEVSAIERHFGTMRLVRFTLPRTGEQLMEVETTLVADLAPALGPKPPNVEGLTWVGEASLLLVTDNHYGRKTGPVLAFSVEWP